MQWRGAVISVIDTGMGIRPEDAKWIFQPFFSTKSTKGTGLGLWISKGIVQKYNGRISFRSVRQERGCATCFRVFLPTSPASGIAAGKAGKMIKQKPGAIADNRDGIWQRVPTAHPQPSDPSCLGKRVPANHAVVPNTTGETPTAEIDLPPPPPHTHTSSARLASLQGEKQAKDNAGGDSKLLCSVGASVGHS